jgi:hypothetical protein
MIVCIGSQPSVLTPIFLFWVYGTAEFLVYILVFISKFGETISLPLILLSNPQN